MDPTLIALYRSPAVARLVRDELERLGIERNRITVLPGARMVPSAAEASALATTQGNLDDALERLESFNLAGGEVRACQQALRSGGFVVSVSLESGSDLDRVQRLIDRPDGVHDQHDQEDHRTDAAVTPYASRWAAAATSEL